MTEYSTVSPAPDAAPQLTAELDFLPFFRRKGVEQQRGDLLELHQQIPIPERRDHFFDGVKRFDLRGRYRTPRFQKGGADHFPFFLPVARRSVAFDQRIPFQHIPDPFRRSSAASSAFVFDKSDDVFQSEPAFRLKFKDQFQNVQQFAVIPRCFVFVGDFFFPVHHRVV